MLNSSAKFWGECAKDEQGRVFQILRIIGADWQTAMNRVKNTIHSKLLYPRFDVSDCLAVTLE